MNKQRLRRLVGITAIACQLMFPTVKNYSSEIYIIEFCNKNLNPTLSPSTVTHRREGEMGIATWKSFHEFFHQKTGGYLVLFPNTAPLCTNPWMP